MPLMSPNHQAQMRAQEVLQELTGEKKGPTKKTEELTVADRLQLAGLGLDQTLENLAHTANNSANEGLRVRANETALKLHGVLKEAAQVSNPSFTIVINDSQPSTTATQNLEGVNPIFLPRQLLSGLAGKEQSNLTSIDSAKNTN
jgi:hypothetical protein